jgi:hypothetical protein
LPDEGWRACVGQVQFHRIAIDLAEDVLEVVGVEADLEARRVIVRRQFLGGRAVVGRRDRKRHLVGIERHLDRAGLFGGDGGNAIDAFKEAARIEPQQLVVAGGNDPAVIGERPVDQLAGQHPRRSRRPG